MLFLPVAAPELSSDNFNGGWGIDDIDNSFSTRPFLIRDARQDVFLSVLISFNLALGKNEVMISLFFFFFFGVWEEGGGEGGEYVEEVWMKAL